MICENITAKDGVLYFAGQDTTKLAAEYGTPLYLFDEDYARKQCRIYKDAFKKHFGPGSYPLYASKANCFKRLYRVMQEEGMGLDVVSSGEIYTAALSGYDLGKAYFQGNNKTDEDIAFAMDKGVGYFVSDNVEEVLAIEKEAAKRGTKQKILLRLTPGIDPHTYEAIATGKVDSKFGSAIETGQADEITALTLRQPHIELMGFHCHVGSQVFGEDVFERAAAIMLEFIAEMKQKYGYTAQMLDLGGGYGVRYLESDPQVDLEGNIARVAAVVKSCCAKLGLDIPEIHMEPGRSIVAEAGMTLYTCGTVKKIPGYKNYVSIDGGMTDNPRYALYGSSYTVLPAERMGEERSDVYTVGGRCCESGDVVQERVPLPEPKRGDLLAVLTTGAYNHSMASNYNNTPRPPMVMLNGAEDTLAIRRETWEDIARREV